MDRFAKKTLLIILSAILMLSAVTALTACRSTGAAGEAKARESYDFDLNNDRFTGEQNDQEMGDYQISFYGDIEAFSGLTVGKGVDDEVWKEWLQITDDRITVYDAENQKVTDEYEHDLKFKDYIAVVISADMNGKARIEVMTNSGSFAEDGVGWVGRNGRLFAEAVGGNTVLRDCTLSYHCNGWDKRIWMYGDSYFSTYAKDRWTTYLTEGGASDILLSGHDGEGSEEALTAFRTQLRYGTPETVVWCMGMNDGDSEDAINEPYKKSLDEVISICKEKDIELILATIPTCPYWFNDHKNEYVKSLGYRFIDFADAVGSYDSTTWREGMLEEGEKRIHPTKDGARALYGKAAATVPELLR